MGQVGLNAYVVASHDRSFASHEGSVATRVVKFADLIEGRRGRRLRFKARASSTPFLGRGSHASVAAFGELANGDGARTT